ncbi:MAG: hypothetical protein QM535_20100 [Limnohabitans sp.]|nr:hypothetical protein [Limnohabitans sp.]
MRSFSLFRLQFSYIICGCCGESGSGKESGIGDSGNGGIFIIGDDCGVGVD